MKQVSLFLMTQKGLDVLNSIVQNLLQNLIDIVVIGRDPKILDDSSADIKALCNAYNIPFCYRNDHFKISSPYAIAISWRWLIDLPNSKLIVLHDSLLPRYRGFAPLVNQLVNGEKEIGVTALWASSEYDRGDIISQEKISIEYPLKIKDAIEMIAPLYSRLTCNILEKISNKKELIGTAQVEEQASYSLWRDEEDYRINWSDSAERIARFIDAVGYPYAGAEAILNGAKVKILESEVIQDVDVEIRQTGKVIFVSDNYPVVVCGKGLLKLKEMQDATGNSMLPLKRFRVRFS